MLNQTLASRKRYESTAAFKSDLMFGIKKRVCAVHALLSVPIMSVFPSRVCGEVSYDHWGAAT